MPEKRITIAKTVGLTIGLFLLQFAFSRLGGQVSRMFDTSAADADGLFLQISIHHIIQMLLALLTIYVLHKCKGMNGFKLSPKFDPKGMRYAGIFCLVILLYYLVLYIAGHYLQSVNVYDYELNRTNVLGTLGFQLFLSGPSEEILFRSLPIVLYLHVLNPEKKRDRVLAIVLSSLLFGVAHINFFEFAVSWFQVCYAFVLGLAYGFTFIRSKSVIYPMLMHSISNVISVGGCYLYMLFTASDRL